MDGTGGGGKKARDQLALRHEPRQERSRARLQALLDAADEVIAESGLQGLAMREIARRAKSPIASVYHYFPSTAALVRAVAERQLAKLNSILENGLRMRFPANGAGYHAEQIASLIDDAANFFFQTPSAPEIWASLHAYPELRALNFEDSMKNAALLKPYLVRLFPTLDAERAGVAAIVLIESVSGTLRFAMSASREVRPQIVDALKTFLIPALAGYAHPAASPAGAKSGAY